MAVIVGTAGAGPSRAEDANGAARGSVYRRPLGNDPSTLDPARISDIYSRSVAQQIFDGLIEFDQTLAISPAIARFWKASRDGLSWTFHLRQGVRFHHGRELVADDVVYSLTRLLDPKLRSGGADLFMNIVGAAAFRDGKASQVSGLKALDRYTVQVDLTESSTPFVSTLAVGHAKIVPRELVQAQGVAFGLHPIGTGPFKFARWDRAKEILLQANPDYFQGPPKLSGVVYRIFRGEDSDRMCAEFDRGQLEESPVPPLCKAKVGDPGYQYVRRVTFSVRFYGLNTRLKPLGDRRVRQAIAHAIDRPRILQEVFPGRFQPANGILPPGTPGYNPGIRFLPRDVAQAKALLAQAGYPRSGGVPPLAIWSSVKSERITKELALVANQLAEIGIRADVRYDTNWPSFFKRLLAGEFPMFVLAWYADVPDPDNFLFKLFFSQSDRNFTGYTNGSVDDLLSGARRERSFFRRAELYHRAEQLILDDAPIIPLWHYTYERLFQPYVRSVEVNGLGDPYIPLRKVWLEVPR